MIKLTRLNGNEFVVNANLIRFVEARPDTTITLTSDDKVIVRESVDEVVRRVIEYARQPDAGIDWPIMLVPLENPVVQFSPFNFSTGQILCFLMIAAGLICLFAFRARAKREAARASAEAAPRLSARRLRQKLK